MLVTDSISSDTLVKLSTAFKKYANQLALDYAVIPHPRDLTKTEADYFIQKRIKSIHMSIPTETALQRGLLKVNCAFFYSNTTLLYSLPLLDHDIEMYVIHSSLDINNWDHIEKQSVRNEHLTYFKMLSQTYSFQLENQFEEGAIFKLTKKSKGQELGFECSPT